jgi:hypothetical protein
MIEDYDDDVMLVQEAFETKRANLFSIIKYGERIPVFLFRKGNFVSDYPPDLILPDIKYSPHQWFSDTENI